MIQLIRSLFRSAPRADLKAIAQNGAVILDVRTPAEYMGGHIKGSLNIPVQNLQGNLSKLKKDKAIITCCASGMRSASAKRILESKGYAEVYNGGSWMSLRNKISK